MINQFKKIVLIIVYIGLIASSLVSSDLYFQQYVKYNLDARLNIDKHSIQVSETLLYTNHSPDTLGELYFHLYLNKYRAGSLVYPELEEDRGGITVESCAENGKQNEQFSIDHTLMKIVLHNPIPPGFSCRFTFSFESRLPDASGRYGYQGMHYDVGNWYITPVVYDSDGWHLNQHLDNEFYQEWGDYNIRIHVPDDFIVGATGNLINNPQISTGLRRAGTEDSTYTTWHFEAQTVHDFAWTADPSYVLTQAFWNGITLNVLAMDYNEQSWSKVSQWGIEALKYLHNTFGPYPYDQITIADTYIRAGGIEYPQIVFINDFINPDFEPGNFRAVVIHEMAHNWFYGLLANNQLQDEWMDEGFATFAEIKTMEAVFGKEGNMNPGDRGWFLNTFSYTNDNRLDQAFDYLRMAKSGLNEDPIDLHADYLGRFSYFLQYTKMANVLFMLEYTLGDSVFNESMLNYYNKWRFKHPGPADFFEVVEETADRDLNWFFDQWLNTVRKLDYAVIGFDGEWQEDTFISTISLERLEEIFMPIDIDITLQDGSIRQFRIPVDPFHKPGFSREILPYWHFSQQKYSTTIQFSQEISCIEIDPSLRLADINRLNNVSGWMPPQEFYFMRPQHIAPPLNRYMWEIWPDILYNDRDKILFGSKFQGSYLDIDHKIDLRLWLKPVRGLVDFNLSYRNPVNWFGPRNQLYFGLYTLDGRQGGDIGLGKRIPGSVGMYHFFDIKIANHLLYDSKYLMAPWSGGNHTYLSLTWNIQKNDERGWERQYDLNTTFLTSVFSGKKQFSQFSFEFKRLFSSRFSDWSASFRIFGGLGDGDTPDQFLFNLSGANSVSEFESPFYRSRGSLPYPWRREGHLYKSGGGNVRGYSLADVSAKLLARNILAANFDIAVPNPIYSLYIPIISDIVPSLFIDYGAVWNHTLPKLSKFKASAGFNLKWETFSFLDYAFNLSSIQVDIPLWLNSPGVNQKRTKFRWLIRFDFNI
jgi:aminopeptidase N